MIKDLDGVVRACGLQGIEIEKDGWRAESPFVQGTDKNRHLYIYRDEGFKCFKSGEQGNVVTLFAKIKGYPDRKGAYKELCRMGLAGGDSTLVNGSEDSTKKHEEEKVSKATLAMVRSGTRTVGEDWDEVAKWRGLPREIFDRCALNGTFGRIHSVEGFGSCYAFMSHEIGESGLTDNLKMVHVRHTLPEMNPAWRTFGSYPVWIPQWNKEAEEVWITEGQWDAIALLHMFLEYSSEASEKIQIMAIAGPKNVAAHAGLLKYFNNKKIVQIPDADDAGEKFFIQTYEALAQMDCKHSILRVPKEARVHRVKDVNDWWKYGVKINEFKDWCECIDDNFNVTQHGIIDDEFKEKHHLPLDKNFIIDEDGVPHELITEKPVTEEPVSKQDLLELCKPYPLLHKFLKECIDRNDAPPFWMFMCFLAYFAGICGRRFKFETGLFPNLYVMCVGSSGIGKSRSLFQLAKAASAALNNVMMSDSFSGESFLDQLSEQNQKMFVCPEFVEWLKAPESSYRAYAANVFMKMYDIHFWNRENPYKTNFRKTKCEIAEPSISMVGACVPHQLDTSKENLKGGLIGRFLFAIGRDFHADYPISRDITSEMKNEIKTLYEGILKTPIRDDASMMFTDKAHLIFVAEFKKSRAEWRKTDSTENMKTYSSREQARLIKLSMVFELLKGDKKWPLDNSNVKITESSLITAIQINSVFKRNFLEIFESKFELAEEEGSTPSRDNKIQKRILKFMNSKITKEGMSKRDILRHIQEKSDIVDQNLRSLLDQRRVALIVKKPSNRGRPSNVYMLINDAVKVHTNGHS